MMASSVESSEEQILKRSGEQMKKLIMRVNDQATR